MDGHVNVVMLGVGDRASSGLRLDEKSFYAPALAAHRDELVLAWTAPDGRINVARLQYGLVRPAVD